MVKMDVAVPVSVAVAQARNFLAQNGIEVFAEFDHGKNARAVDLALPETVVLVFGNPQVGTYLMQDDGDVALALPLKMLFYTLDGAHTRIAYDKPSEWSDIYHFGEESKDILVKLDGLLAKLAAFAGGVKIV